MVSSSESSSFLSLVNSPSSDKGVCLVLKEGRPRFPVGADLRRGGAVVLLDFEAGLGGLKEGALRLGAGFEVVGGIVGRGGGIYLLYVVELRGRVLCRLKMHESRDLYR